MLLVYECQELVKVAPHSITNAHPHLRGRIQYIAPNERSRSFSRSPRPCLGSAQNTELCTKDNMLKQASSLMRNLVIFNQGLKELPERYSLAWIHSHSLTDAIQRVTPTQPFPRAHCSQADADDEAQGVEV